MISEVPKCFKIKLSLQRSPDPLADGEGLAASGAKNPAPALGPSGLVSTGLRVTDYRVDNPINDAFQIIGLYEIRIFRFRRTEKMKSVMKGLMGQWPPEFLG